MLHIIHRFSLTGHPHCLAIILVTQTNVEMMVAFGGTVIVFYEGMFSLPKISVDYIVLCFHSSIRGTAVCGVPRLIVPLAFHGSPLTTGGSCRAAIYGPHLYSRHL